MSSGVHNESWILAGDFHVVKDPREIEGGRGLTNSNMGDLNECINQCSLEDLRLSGNLYT